MIIKIDNKLLVLKKNINLTIFQLCNELGINLPNFCYFEKLSIAGNCRMCVVEVLNAKNLVVSCATNLLNNMIIFTNTLRVKKARKSTLEFLLVNHPLDCPICDQGGECDLQDITLVFGSNKGRFFEIVKRSAVDENFGPFVKSIMTRCIHCTRCIRFLWEISGEMDLGMIGRGSLSQVSTYLGKNLLNELSGNIIDLCPVGALTSKPYSFRARPWELEHIDTIDIFDSMGSSIRIDIMNNCIVRVLPIYNNLVNEYWITNKVRFSYDILANNRYYYPKFNLKGYQRVCNNKKEEVNIFFSLS